MFESMVVLKIEFFACAFDVYQYQIQRIQLSKSKTN